MTTARHDVPLWMTLAEAGKIAEESRQTLWRRSKDGSLRTTQHGRTIKVSRDALLEYMGMNPEIAGSPTVADGTPVPSVDEKGDLHVVR